MSGPVLRLANISKTFPAVKALSAVDIEVRPNEVIGLVGENGAGKSTLMKILTGVYPPDPGGVIAHDGKPIALRTPLDAAAAGIGMVHQEQSLLLNISVAENIFLGKERPFIRRGLIDRKAMNEAARKQLLKVQLDIDPRTRTEDLSFAARQMVELAKVLTLEEESAGHLVILLDEPTSVLEKAEIDILFARVRALKSRASFVFVSHRLDEILELADRIYVMKDGAVVAEMQAADASVNRMHELMVGRGLHTEYYKENRQQAFAAEPALRVEGLAVAGAYRGVDFTLHQGEVLGIAGVIGSGRETLSRTLAGLHPPTAGRIELMGRPVRLASATEAVRLGIGYIPQERRTEGVVLALPMAANITLPALEKLMPRGILRHGTEARIAKRWVERLSIRPPDPRVAMSGMSGGNQQKVVLAKWIEAGARVLILDHPTRGLDVGAKEEVYELIRDVTAQGVAVILTADTLEETIGLSHTILVMRDGEITGRFEAPQGRKPDQLALIEHMV